MINCIENSDGTFTISWDENDPHESVLNTWSHDDFVNVIMEECQRHIKKNNET